MKGTLHFFVMSTYALFLAAKAGTWDSFELGYAYSGDTSKCFSMKHNIQMLLNLEYQVPDECKTIFCHKSYIVSERILEVGKKYDTIGACGRISCDSKGKLEVEQCEVLRRKPLCSVGKDNSQPYPKCCPFLICK